MQIHSRAVRSRTVIITGDSCRVLMLSPARHCGHRVAVKVVSMVTLLRSRVCGHCVVVKSLWSLCCTQGLVVMLFVAQPGMVIERHAVG